MTEADKYAEVGRAVERAQKVEGEIKRLELAAYRLGKVFSDLGQALQTDLNGIVLEKESWEGKVEPSYVLNQLDQKDLNVESVRMLVNEYRALLVEKDALRQRLTT